MHKGMLTYYQAAMADHLRGKKRPRKFPPKGHYFWKCLPPLVERPHWLSDEHAVIPWKDVMAHPQRPRCATCLNWEPHHTDEKGIEWGNCMSPKEPMGVSPLIPEDSLCSRDYQPNLG